MNGKSVNFNGPFVKLTYAILKPLNRTKNMQTITINFIIVCTVLFWNIVPKLCVVSLELEPSSTTTLSWEAPVG